MTEIGRIFVEFVSRAVVVAVALSVSLLAAAYVTRNHPIKLIFGCEKTYINERGEDTGECY